MNCMSHVQIAEVCHEANRAYCLALGDHSQKHWGDAPQWQRESCVDGVRFHLAYPDATASASHDNWLRTKEADGWGYGDVKDEVNKTHPCIRPFDDLPEVQRRKDMLFRSIVHTLAPLTAEFTETFPIGDAAMNDSTKALLAAAADEIRTLRRSNELSGAKVEVMEVFACALHTHAPLRREFRGTKDIGWEIDKLLDESA